MRTRPAANDRVVIEALRESAHDLRRFVRARVRGDDADDVFQAASIRAVEKADSLRDPAHVVPWLYRIFRNVAIDASRSQTSARRVFDQTAEAAEQATDRPSEGCRCSLSQSRQIAASYAEILDLVDVRGYSLGEAAEDLEISVNNATVRLHRARQALKKQMREHCGVESLRECLSCRCIDDGCCAV